MAEHITLTTAETNTTWKLYRLEFSTPPDPYQVVMWFVNDLGERKSHAYSGDEAKTILQNVNKRDFSGTNPSMYKAAMQKAINDGVFSGTVEGSETL